MAARGPLATSIATRADVGGNRLSVGAAALAIAAAKHREWYGAFALLVMLVWLYLEILRLLSKLAGRG